MSTRLQGKTCILLTLPTVKKKKKMAAKEWTDDKTFQFRNEKELIPMGKNILCKRRANETSVYVKLYSL